MDQFQLARQGVPDMKTACACGHGAAFRRPEVLEMADMPEPVAGPGQVLVAVSAVPVLYVDTQIRAGPQHRPRPQGGVR
jgi:hypothetical protein